VALLSAEGVNGDCGPHRARPGQHRDTGADQGVNVLASADVLERPVGLASDGIEIDGHHATDEAFVQQPQGRR